MMNIWKSGLAAGIALVVMASAIAANAGSEGGMVSAQLSPCDIRTAVKGYDPGIALLALHPEPLLPKDRLPALSGQVLYGALRIGPQQALVNIAVEQRGTGEMANYRVFVDSNANGDLRDDPLPAWTRVSERTECVIRTDDMALRLLHSLDRGDRPYLRYSIVTSRCGTIDTGGSKIRVAIIDGNNDGRYDSKETDKMVVDLNGDGVLDATPGSNELLSLDDSFSFKQNKWSVVALQSDGTRLTFSGTALPAGTATAPARTIETRPEVGYMAPAFSEKDIGGRTISLADYRGKVVLLDFWATWCGPCRRELPHVLSAYKRFKGKDFEIIGISLDTDTQQFRSFVQQNAMEWPQLYDGRGWQNKLARAYGVHAIPATFLIGRDGKIIGRDLRGSALVPGIERALKQ